VMIVFMARLPADMAAINARQIIGGRHPPFLDFDVDSSASLPLVAISTWTWSRTRQSSQRVHAIRHFKSLLPKPKTKRTPS
jgi:hypothetical protein